MSEYYEDKEDEYYEFLESLESPEDRLFTLLEVSYMGQNPESGLEEVVDYYKYSMKGIAQELYRRKNISIGNDLGNFILTEVKYEDKLGYRVIFRHAFNSEKKKESIVLTHGSTLVDYVYACALEDPKNEF